MLGLCQDGWRICTFTKAAAEMGFPARFDAPDPQKEKFFREHFFHTLLVRFNGGDIRGQYTIHDMINMVDRLRSLDDDDGAQIDPKDGLWQDEMGRDALALVDFEA